MNGLLVRVLFFLACPTLLLSSLSCQLNILIDIKNIYSKEREKEIYGFIKNKISSDIVLKKDLKFVLLDLKKNYKIIKKIEVDYSSPSSVFLNIDGVEPFCTINNKFVLGNKKRLFDYESFKDFDFKKLKNIYVKESFLQNKIDVLLNCFIKSIPENILNKYDLNYQNRSEVFLRPKEILGNNFLVLTDQKFVGLEKISLFDDPDNVSKIRGQYNKLLKKRRELFDLRFNNCILVKLIDKNFLGREPWD